jgi:VanZ family protein
MGSRMRFNLKTSTTARYLWPAAIGAVVIGSLSPADSSLMHAVASLRIDDKVLHFSAYVFLAILPVLGMRRKMDALLGAGSMMLLGLLLEIAQHFVPGRSPEVADEAANMVGVACGMVMAFPFRAGSAGLSPGSKLVERVSCAKPDP